MSGSTAAGRRHGPARPPPARLAPQATGRPSGRARSCGRSMAAASHATVDGDRNRACFFANAWPQAGWRFYGTGARSLPSEVVALPDIRPAVPARILASAPLEAVRLAGRVGLGRSRLAEHPAKVDEVLLRCGALLQLGGAPLGDELLRFHRCVQRGPGPSVPAVPVLPRSLTRTTPSLVDEAPFCFLRGRPCANMRWTASPTARLNFNARVFGRPRRSRSCLFMRIVSRTQASCRTSSEPCIPSGSWYPCCGFRRVQDRSRDLTKSSNRPNSSGLRQRRSMAPDCAQP